MERRKADDRPVTIIIFGASGDLTERKLVPALFHLFQEERLPANTRIIGFSRRPYTDQHFRDLLRESAMHTIGDSFDGAAWERFAPRIHYVPGDAQVHEDYARLRAFVRQGENGPANRLYYLATPPSLYAPTVERLGAVGMAREEDGWRRIIVEKPFGHDLPSAQQLNRDLHAVFDEHQIYRIDHYLGKETAQNILFFRFANLIFEPVWDRRYVSSVQITVAESVGVGHRARYYDHAGVLRDMFQNHLLQLLALVAMEPPASFNADAVRNEKAKVLGAIRPVLPSDTVRAQYRGYCETADVAPRSQTATFAAIKLYVDTWRWQGVPFFLRSGKALAEKSSEVSLEFQCPPRLLLDDASTCSLRSNVLTLCIQPDEGIHLKFEMKAPGSSSELRSVDMDFHYRSILRGRRLPDAYERLLLDALNGDASLFTRADEIELAWRLIDPIQQAWEGPDAPPLEIYEDGSWGPEGANALIRRSGRVWRRGCCDHLE
ncbi:MAG TPA: glucose-6-phosphate dehydrogenase [Armatimonadetes bacterium]|jgi:glucose-6-phosphate 1-dehydrogenase|nr:glucose-6-phosphate dehydrogenase [Armatimonadota bacterium]